MNGDSTRCARLKTAAKWVLRVVALLPVLFVLFLVSGLSPRFLIQIASEDEWGSRAGLPFDYGPTLRCCLGPTGWIVVLMVFGLALSAAMILRRCPWAVRMVVVLSPLLLVLFGALRSDLHAWLRPWFVTILALEILLAALAAVLARRMANAAAGIFAGKSQTF